MTTTPNVPTSDPNPDPNPDPNVPDPGAPATPHPADGGQDTGDKRTERGDDQPAPVEVQQGDRIVTYTGTEAGDSRPFTGTEAGDVTPEGGDDRASTDVDDAASTDTAGSNPG